MIEEEVALTQNQTQELYNYVTKNILLFKSLAEKNIPENRLETGTISYIEIKCSNLEIQLNLAIQGITAKERKMLWRLHNLVDSFKKIKGKGEFKIWKMKQ